MPGTQPPRNTGLQSTSQRVFVLTRGHFRQDIQGDPVLKEWLTGT